MKTTSMIMILAEYFARTNGKRRILMPEGPEVKTIVDALHRLCAGKTILNIRPRSGRYLNKPIVGLRQAQFPLGVRTVACKGKFIYFNLNEENYIFNTLGMTGNWRTSQDKYSRVEIIFDDNTSIFYSDVRSFGTLKLVQGKDNLNKKLKSIGPDLLSEKVNFKCFNFRFTRKNKTVAENLMDQSIVAGVGNYLKSEILYAAKISPHRSVNSLSSNELEKIYKNAKDIIRFSYTMGGATIKDYYTIDGKSGAFSRRFAVYNQTKDPLGNDVVREKTKDKRTTHWVPNIQK
jgi:formamidopyrimidine-DNA glycosylase